MPSITLNVTRVVSEDFPGWVEAFLTDAEGKRWRFVDKEPVFGLSKSLLPTEVSIPCSIVFQSLDATAKETVTIKLAYHLSDADTGIEHFRVTKEQVSFD